jgi:hypothetical protein
MSGKAFSLASSDGPSPRKWFAYAIFSVFPPPQPSTKNYLARQFSYFYILHSLLYTELQELPGKVIFGSRCTPWTLLKILPARR